MEKTLVIGASTNPNRYSNLVIHRLRAKGHPVVAIGREQGEVEDVKIESSMIEREDIDTVTLYLNPKHQPEYYDYIVSLDPRRVIFNPGTENPEFSQILLDNDIEVEIACSLVLLASNQY